MDFRFPEKTSVSNAEVQKYERQRSVAKRRDARTPEGNKEQKAMEQADRIFSSDQLEGHSCIYRGQDDRLDRSISNCLIIESVSSHFLTALPFSFALL